MSQIAYADPAAPAPDLGVPQAPHTETDQVRVRRAMMTSMIPAAISLGVNFIFFIVYWIPETSHFPGRSGLLTELSPLASKYLASGGTEIVGLQREQLGLSPILLLITSLLIAWARANPLLACPGVATGPGPARVDRLHRQHRDPGASKPAPELLARRSAVDHLGRRSGRGRLVDHGDRRRLAATEELSLRPGDAGGVRDPWRPGHGHWTLAVRT